MIEIQISRLSVVEQFGAVVAIKVIKKVKVLVFNGKTLTVLKISCGDEYKVNDGPYAKTTQGKEHQ